MIPFLRAALAPIVVGGFLIGCGSGRGTLAELSSDRLLLKLNERGVPKELAEPVALSAEMKAWVSALPLFGTPEERVEQLLQSILRRKEAPFVYTNGNTTAVAETWRTGRANCLSFSQLFVALARELGLDAYFLRVRDLTSFNREGDLVVSSDHVTAAWGPMQVRRVLDFTDRPVRDYHEVDVLEDLASLALYYSNVGAERIRAGEMQAARELLETATRVDADLADGWINLGVARRRLGDLDGAEAAYRRALEADPQVTSTYNNLAKLLELRGRPEEGKRLLALGDQQSNRNPWSYLELGDWALAERHFDDAERYYKKAKSLAYDNPEPLAALGEAALASGRERDARRWLKRAAALDPTNPRVVALSTRLDRL